MISTPAAIFLPKGKLGAPSAPNDPFIQAVNRPASRRPARRMAYWQRARRQRANKFLRVDGLVGGDEVGTEAFDFLDVLERTTVKLGTAKPCLRFIL